MSPMSRAMPPRRRGALPVVALAVTLGMLMLGACRTVAPPPEWAGPTPEARVAAIRAAGAPVEGEFEVRPLREPRIEEWSEAATTHERAGRLTEAAGALDQALALAPDDTALLQARAEVALLLRDPATAERLARRAHAAGGTLGPLCRRHWTTVEQVALLAQARAEAAIAVVDASGKPPSGDEAQALAGWRHDIEAALAVVDEARRARTACTLTPPPRY